jgi:hypothetical protein
MSRLRRKEKVSVRTFLPLLVTLATAACAHGDDPSGIALPAHSKDGGGGAFGGDQGVDASAGAGGEALEAALPHSSGGNNIIDASNTSDARDSAAIVDTGSPLRPTGVTVSAQTMPSPLDAPSAGGNQTTDPCPINQVLVGFNGTADASVDGGPTLLRSVQGVCAPLTVTAYQVKVGAATTLLPQRNNVGGVPVNALCPADQVVVGFGGLTAQFIQSLDFRCAPLVIAGTSPSFTLSIGNVSTTNQIGTPTGTPFTAIMCPNNQVAVGQTPHAGADIDAFGVTCAALLLVVQ